MALYPVVRNAIALSAGLLLAACAGNSAPQLAAGPQSQKPHPDARALEAQLRSELARLGVDPAKAGSKVASGPDSVFFGEDTNIVANMDVLAWASADLQWYFRLVGDYDANGEVGISDVSAIAQHFGEHVSYRPAAQAGGYAYWPQGDYYSTNATLARIDGDGNGEINLGDITPLARHFGERADGFNVYRKQPGESGFTLLTSPGSPELPYSVKFSQEKTSLAHNHFWGAITTAGSLEFRVVAVDSNTGQESSASRIFTVLPNEAPLADFSVSSDGPNVPATLTLDAAASFDPEGQALSYVYTLTVGDGGPQPWPGASADPVQSGTVFQAGDFTFDLTVTDRLGRHATASRTFHLDVAGQRSNSWTFSDPPAAAVDYGCTATALAEISGEACIAASIVDYQGDYAERSIQYFSTAGAAGPWRPAVSLPLGAGGFGGFIRLRDINGPAMLVGSVGYTGAAMYFVHATDAQGQAWTDPASINTKGVGSYSADLINLAGTPTICSQLNMAQLVALIPANSQWETWTTKFTILAPEQSIPVAYAQVQGGIAAASLSNEAGSERSLFVYSGAADGGGWKQSCLLQLPVAPGQYSLTALDSNGRLGLAYRLGSKIYYAQAIDAGASSFIPEVIAAPDCPKQDGGAVESGYCLALIGGLPAIAYRTADSRLMYSIASSADGSNWSAPELVSSYGVTGGMISLAEIGGQAAVVYHNLSTRGLEYGRRNQ